VIYSGKVFQNILEHNKKYVRNKAENGKSEPTDKSLSRSGAAISLLYNDIDVY
jgi:hypothetical protein